MKNSAKFAVAVAALVVVAAIAGAVAYGKSDAGTKTTKLHYTVKFSPLTVIDIGTKGYSRGDEIVAWDVLYTAAGAKAGHDTQACVITNLKPLEADCTLTFVFPNGTITAQYMGSPPARKVVAVTGGTGKFIGARGELVIVESGHDNSKNNTADFTLLG